MYYCTIAVTAVLAVFPLLTEALGGILSNIIDQALPTTPALTLDQILALGENSIILPNIIDQIPHPGAQYDFIIIGAGSAGCVLANRLSENPNWTVYLIEAGGLENAAHQIPVIAHYLQSTPSNWGYKSTPQNTSCFGMYNNECGLPRGKVVGGSSSINFMLYSRGSEIDYNRWAAEGNTGWSYEEVLPYFLKSEGAKLVGLENSPYHNHTGPLSVEDVDFRSQTSHAYIQAAQQAGHPYTDYNGQSQLGVSYVQATTKDGRRDSVFRAFIEPIQSNRTNLIILTGAKVTKVLIDPATKVANGVELYYLGVFYEIYAKKEVILSAGAFNTPQILMLSGVGPAEHLQDIGVPLIQDLPVGVSFLDHISHYGPTFTTNTTHQTIYPTDATPMTVGRFYSGDPATFMSSTGAVEALTFIKVPNSTEPANLADIELLFVDGSFASDFGTFAKLGANMKENVYETVYKPLADNLIEHFSILNMLFHPKSRGSVRLSSANPLDDPIINANYLNSTEDVEILLAGIKESINIVGQPAMQSLNATIWDIPVPGCESWVFGTDDYWRCSIHTLSYTIYHPVGTCRMGPQSNGTTVVDPTLKVHGIENLRIVDASIVPTSSTAHINAVAIMIAEKASDMIRGDWT